MDVIVTVAAVDRHVRVGGVVINIIVARAEADFDVRTRVIDGIDAVAGVDGDVGVGIIKNEIVAVAGDDGGVRTSVSDGVVAVADIDDGIGARRIVIDGIGTRARDDRHAACALVVNDIVARG